VSCLSVISCSSCRSYPSSFSCLLRWSLSVVVSPCSVFFCRFVDLHPSSFSCLLRQSFPVIVSCCSVFFCCLSVHLLSSCQSSFKQFLSHAEAVLCLCILSVCFLLSSGSSSFCSVILSFFLLSSFSCMLRQFPLSSFPVFHSSVCSLSSPVIWFIVFLFCHLVILSSGEQFLLHAKAVLHLHVPSIFLLLSSGSSFFHSAVLLFFLLSSSFSRMLRWSFIFVFHPSFFFCRLVRHSSCSVILSFFLSLSLHFLQVMRCPLHSLSFLLSSLLSVYLISQLCLSVVSICSVCHLVILGSSIHPPFSSYCLIVSSLSCVPRQSGSLLQTVCLACLGGPVLHSYLSFLVLWFILLSCLVVVLSLIHLLSLLSCSSVMSSLSRVLRQFAF